MDIMNVSVMVTIVHVTPPTHVNSKLNMILISPTTTHIHLLFARKFKPETNTPVWTAMSEQQTSGKNILLCTLSNHKKEKLNFRILGHFFAYH